MRSKLKILICMNLFAISIACWVMAWWKDIHDLPGLAEMIRGEHIILAITVLTITLMGLVITTVLSKPEGGESGRKDK